jgi:hypothetical protein
LTESAGGLTGILWIFWYRWYATREKTGYFLKSFDDGGIVCGIFYLIVNRFLWGVDMG